MEYNITYRKKDKGIQYIISYKVDGKWKQKSKQGFDRVKDAKPVAEKQLEELKKEVELTAKVEPKYKGITFGKFVEDLIEHEKLHKTANTIRSMGYAVSKFEDLKEKQLTEIKNSDIQKCVDKMIKDGIKISSIKTYLANLKYMLNQAVRPHKIISASPVEDIKLPALQYSTKKAKKALSKKEIDTLFGFLKNESKYLQYYFLCSFALGTGLRRGELLGLTWDNVDSKNREVNVVQQWKWIGEGKEGFGTLKKQNSKRVVPVAKSTLDELAEYKREFNIIGMDNRVFPFNLNTTATIIDRESKKAGIPIGLHTLRHTYATNLIANGVDFKTAAAILGHDVEMTMSVYSHVTDDMMKKAAEKIEKIFLTDF